MAKARLASRRLPFRSPYRKPTLIASVADDRFMPGLVVMLHSLQTHLDAAAPVRYRIFYDPEIASLSPANQSILQCLFPGITLQVVENAFYRQGPCDSEEHRPAYLTLEIFRAHGFQQHLFVDSDVLVLGDLWPLLSLGLCFYAARAAVYSLDEGYQPWTKINTGFFGFTGPATAGFYYEDLMMGISSPRQQGYGLLDQILINQLGRQQHFPLYLLPEFYNYRNWGGGGKGSLELMISDLSAINVLHFSGYRERPKPWQYDHVVVAGLADHLAYQLWAKAARRLVQEHPFCVELFAGIDDAYPVKQ